MTPTVEWIAAYALPLSALLLVLAVLLGDLAWQRNARWQRDVIIEGRRVMLRPQTGVRLLVVLVLLFVAIAFAIHTSLGELVQFDTSLAKSLHAALTPPTLRAIAQLTHLGGLLWIAPATGIVLLVLLWRRHWQLSTAWSLALLGILPINMGLKACFQRVRPLHDHGLIVAHSWSFPSGHAFGAIVSYGMLAYVLLRLLPLRFHRAVIAAAVALIGAVGLSRALLQVHYFSDVLGGFVSGAAWLVICIGVAEYLHSRPSTHSARGTLRGASSERDLN